RKLVRADTARVRRPFGVIVPVLVTCGGLPVASLALFGEHEVMPPMWVHFYGVGVSALAATALAVAVTWVGAREGDVRTVVVGGGLEPALVPGVPAPKSAPALALFALGLAVYGALAVRATNTFLLTRRAADFAVVLGIVLLACSLYGALVLYFMDLGWWLGHIFELAGILVVGGSLVYDLRRGRRSRALVGDLRAAELVASVEAYLGARVRALTVRR